jgi:hypothetical protein
LRETVARAKSEEKGVGFEQGPRASESGPFGRVQGPSGDYGRELRPSARLGPMASAWAECEGEGQERGLRASAEGKPIGFVTETRAQGRG